MPDKRPALGRGLNALIPAAPPPSRPAPPAHDRDRPSEIDIDLLTVNPAQPRTVMDEGRLDELAQSIRANGVIQPIVVRKVDHRFEIVAGERRWRAAQRAGLLKVPVVHRDVPNEKLLEIALVENIQREDLNPIEEAHAYRRLADELHMSQDAIADAVGKDRATVANYMRLLKLSAEVRADVSAGTISMGHARALLGLADEAAQRRVARETIAHGLSVRETEALVKRESAPASAVSPAPRVDPNTKDAEERLRMSLGTRVRIVRKGKGGRIEIDFVSEDELQRLFDALTD